MTTVAVLKNEAMSLHRLLIDEVEALAPTSLPVPKNLCVVRLAALQVAAIQDWFWVVSAGALLAGCSHLHYGQRMLLAKGILPNV